VEKKFVANLLVAAGRVIIRRGDHLLMADRFPTAATLACAEHAGTVSQSEYVR